MLKEMGIKIVSAYGTHLQTTDHHKAWVRDHMLAVRDFSCLPPISFLRNRSVFTIRHLEVISVSFPTKNSFKDAPTKSMPDLPQSVSSKHYETM
jgi:hypothetical protein